MTVTVREEWIFRIFYIKTSPKGVIKLAQPNFQYEKRQRDLVKKKKQEEKRQRKLDKSKGQPGETPDQVLNGPNTEDAGKA